MKFCIIASEENIASKNIKESLLDLFNFETIDGKPTLKLGDDIAFIEIIESSLLYFDNPEKNIDADCFVFICSHTSEKGVPSLTVHSPGNFSTADLGGKEKEVSVVNAKLMKLALQELKVNSEKLDYNVCYEATHHGPSISKPCMFIELGSNEIGWRDKEGANCVATSLINAIKKINSVEDPVVAFCLGGTHYNSSFDFIGLNTKFAPGHICPKSKLEFLDVDFFKAILNSSFPVCNKIILDWKGLGTSKAKILSIAEELGIEVLKASDVKKSNIV